MGIPVEWTIVLQYLEGRLPTLVRALERKAVWKGSRGKLRLIARDLELTCLLPSHPRFRSLKFLLTNSKVPRDTKKLVAGVGEKKANVSRRNELVDGSNFIRCAGT